MILNLLVIFLILTVAVVTIWWRAPTSRLGRQAVNACRTVEKNLRAMDPLMQVSRLRLESAGLAAAAHYRAARLQAMPLESLKSVAESAIRWTALRSAGINSVADLANWPEARLSRLYGVGPSTASAASRAYQRVRSAIEVEPVAVPSRLVVEVDWSLAESARSVLETRPISDPLRVQVEREHRTVERLRLDVQDASGFWEWVKARAQPSTDVTRAAEVALEHCSSPALIEVMTLVTEAASALQKIVSERVSRVELQRDYEVRFADYAVLLEEVLNKRRRERDARLPTTGYGGLPHEIVRRIEQQPLLLMSFRGSLRPYQRFGARYLLAQGRTILGDEMGLGKTIQALAAIAHARTQEGASRFLVVAPASVCLNWAREIDKFTDIPAYALFGSDGYRSARVEAWKSVGGIGITSYTTLGMLSLDLIGIDFLIVDEAHYAKNPNAQRSKAVARLLSQTRRVSFLTGTPMENRPGEFIELIKMVEPSLASQLRRHDWGVYTLGIDPGSFRTMVAPRYLRRNQSDVLKELPERIEVEEWVDLPDAEREKYESAVRESRALMTVRWVVTVSSGPHSAKMSRLKELIQQHAEDGRKTLVFSFFRKVLDVAEEILPDALRIDGSHGPKARDGIIQRFLSSDRPLVMLSQIEVGGVGLNLQAASAVILLEPQIKPALEDQAIARSHRMGQTRSVLVHRILARDTIDERMVELLSEKKGSFEQYAAESSLKGASTEATETKDLGERALAAELRRVGSA